MRYPQGLKWTRQRKSAYAALWEAERPLTVAEIYRRVTEGGDSEGYALSTVYRILAAFEEKGLVEKTTWTDDSSVAYSLNRGGHTHYAVCLKCRSRIPLPGCPFAHVRSGQSFEGFTVTGHKLELYGYCRDCGGGNGSAPEDSSPDYVCPGHS